MELLPSKECKNELWDLVNGRSSDLEIPEDRSPNGVLAKGVGYAALVGLTAGAAAAGGLGTGPLLGHAIRWGYKSLAAGVHGREDALLANEENKRLRKSLGRIYLQRVLEKKGGSSELLSRLALVHLSLGYPNEALKTIERALEEFPLNADTLVVASAIYLSRSGNTNITRVTAFEKAIDALNQARRIEPNNYTICCALASVLNDAGHHATANECWKEASLIDTKAAIVWVKQADFYLSSAQYVEAKQCFDEAIARDREIVPPWIEQYKKGELALRSNQLSEAQDCFRKANLLNPNWDRPLWGLSQFTMKLGDFVGSFSLVERAIALNPSDPELYLAAGNMAERLNNLENAHEYWMKAYTLDSRSLVPWVRVLKEGNLALEQRRFEDASRHFKEANRLHGFWQEAIDLECLALRYLKVQALDKSAESAAARRDFKLAEAIWNEAITYPEVESNAYMKLGAIAADRGETEDALRHFHRALEKANPLARKAIVLCRAYHEFDPEVGPR